VRFFNLIGLISLRSTLPEIKAVHRLPVGPALGDTNTAFGIFSRFEVTDFDLLGLFLPRHFLFSFLIGLCCASHTEEQLTPACDVLFWN
jgi:hypothetical protein